jgi:hypothetical protein
LGIPGDFNHDNKVDAADYVVWRKSPGSFPPNAYDTWRANFGAMAGAGSSVPGESGAVPEPSACMLLCVSGLALIATRRGRRRD